MQKTSIEWCDYSVNPIKFRPFGSQFFTNMCQRRSPGCQACYAESITRRFWPKTATVSFPGYTAQGIAAGEFVVDEKQLLSVLKHKKPCKVFWGDMTDIFGEWVPFTMIDKCMAVCALTPHITHMFLTKRPEVMLKYFSNEVRNGGVTRGFIEEAYGRPARFFPSAFDMLPLNNNADMPWPLPNVWVGTSCENQKYADERIPILCQVPAKVHFISAEPLIGDIDLGYPKSIWPNGPEMCCSGYECGCQGLPTEPPLGYGLQLVICGGESGPKARPMQYEWAENLRNDCKRYGISFFMKQMGSVYGEHKGKDLPPDLNIREFPEEKQ